MGKGEGKSPARPFVSLLSTLFTPLFVVLVTTSFWPAIVSLSVRSRSRCYVLRPALVLYFPALFVSCSYVRSRRFSGFPLPLVTPLIVPLSSSARSLPFHLFLFHPPVAPSPNFSRVALVRARCHGPFRLSVLLFPLRSLPVPSLRSPYSFCASSDLLYLYPSTLR